MIKPDDNCLIVESNFLILLDLEGVLESLGFKRIDQAASLGEAQLLLKTKRYRVAFLDVMLKGNGGVRIAKALKKQKIPFALTTTYPDPSILPPDLQDIPMIAKPYSVAAVQRVMMGLLGSS
jgi:CheY-like chemotaxis protein